MMTTGLNKALKEKLKNILISVFPQKADPLQMALKGNELEIAIKEHQPELLCDIKVSAPSFVSNEPIDKSVILIDWLESIKKLVLEKQLTLDIAVGSTLDGFEKLLTSKKLTLSVIAPLLGLVLEEGVEINLCDKVRIKKLSDDKKSDLKEKCAQFLQHSSMLGFLPRPEHLLGFQEKIVSCVYGEFDVPFEFINPNRQPSDAIENQLSPLDIKFEFENACELFLLAVHAVKSGFSEIFITNFELKQIELFSRGGACGILQSPVRSNWKEMQIDKADAKKIKTIYSFLKTPSKVQRNIQLACRRLFLSESRVGSGGMFATTYADGLIDACIGLESILLPSGTRRDFTKIIAENYCKILQLTGQERKFEENEIRKKILNQRGCLVHGGESLSQNEIKCASELAQSKLRKLISAIVIDKAQLHT